MYRLTFLITPLLAVSLVAQEKSSETAHASDGFPGASATPSDARAAKIFAKATKDFEERKYASALDEFRKADQQDGGHCLACEINAYKTAKQLEDFQTARQETMLLLDHVTNPEDKAQVHYLTGDVCLSEGGYRIFQKPFEDADKEFEAALQLQPDKPNCLYADGVALAHLHQYDKAKERFEQYMKLASPHDFEYPRARLFATQPELARVRIAPDFHVVSLDGKPISMGSLAGKVVLIDFWATWCGPCKQALPHLKEIVQKFEGQPLVVISISLDMDEATWKFYVAHNGMTWPQYRDGGFEGPIATSFHVKAIPTTFTIDANGFVQDQQVGDGEIEEKLKKLLLKASSAPVEKAAVQSQ
jgi:thiol-disulfide isomerase/thioredoxin